jgi:hypothetical protein
MKRRRRSYAPLMVMGALVLALVLLAAIDSGDIPLDLDNGVGHPTRPGGGGNTPDDPDDPDDPDPPNIPDVDYHLEYLRGSDADNAVAYILPQISIVRDAEGYIPAAGSAITKYYSTGPGDVPDLPALDESTYEDRDLMLQIHIQGPYESEWSDFVSVSYFVYLDSSTVQAATDQTLPVYVAIGVPAAGIYDVTLTWHEYREGSTVTRWTSNGNQITI